MPEWAFFVRRLIDRPNTGGSSLKVGSINKPPSRRDGNGVSSGLPCSVSRISLRRDGRALGLEAFAVQDIDHPGVQALVGDRRGDGIAAALCLGRTQGQFARPGLFRFHAELPAVIDVCLDT